MLKPKPRRVASKKKLPIEHTGFYHYLQEYLHQRKVIGLCQENDKRTDSSLRQFIAWCEVRGVLTPQEITKPMIERYQAHLFYRRKQNGEPLSFNAQRKYMNYVMRFFSWLAKQNYILYNPASDIDLPRIPKRLPRQILTVEEVENLLDNMNVHSVSGLRNRAILETLYGTAMRRHELITLQLQDVDLKRKSVFIAEGKWGRDRLLPLGERTTFWLKRYINEARPRLVGALQDYTFFMSDYGEPFTPSLFAHWLKRHLRKQGIERGGSHLFRHACATHMLENGADIRFIQALLGHVDLSTTEVYTRVCIEKLRQVHAATHPAKLQRLHAVNDVNHELDPLAALLALDEDDE
jgi:integrase/recombinase XerD